MAPVDGLIVMKIYTNHPLMPDVNISKDEPFKSKGQGEVGEQRSKNAATLQIYRLGWTEGKKRSPIDSGILWANVDKYRSILDDKN